MDASPPPKEGQTGANPLGDLFGTPLYRRFALPFLFFPFILSGFLFASGFLTLLAPFPLLLVYYRYGGVWAAAAVLSNAAILWGMMGWGSSALYGLLVLPIALLVPPVLKKTCSLEITAGAVFIAILGLLVLSGWGYSIGFHIHPIVQFKLRFSELLDQLFHAVPVETQREWLEGLELADWKKDILSELPGLFGIAGLVMVWTNLVLLMRANPDDLRTKLGIRASYFRDWKAPEILVWPTLLAGAAMLFGQGVVFAVGLNLFKFLMSVYAFQGLSIVAFFLYRWRMRRGLRLVVFGFAVMLLLPLILSMGFFDLWFDFRAKFRHS